MPGRDVGGHRLADHARAEQVEPEVARARADLQARARSGRGSWPSALRSLPVTCAWPDLARSRCPTWRRSATPPGRGSARWRRGSLVLVGMGRRAVVSLCLAAVPDAARRAAGPARRACPPLELTGERTLPDVPAENYWFRRHLAVYEWIAAALRRARRGRHGLRRGLRRRGAGAPAPRASPAWTPTPRPTSTPGASTRAPGCASCATWSTATPSPATPSSSCRRSSTCEDPEAVLRHFRDMLRPGGRAYVSTPNVLTLAPEGPRSRTTPGTSRSTGPRSSARAVRVRLRPRRAAGLFHARKLRAHELALRAGWDRVHAGARVHPALYDRFTPAISARDFALRDRPARPGARLRRGAAP